MTCGINYILNSKLSIDKPSVEKCFRYSKFNNCIQIRIVYLKNFIDNKTWQWDMKTLIFVVT